MSIIPLSLCMPSLLFLGLQSYGKLLRTPGGIADNYNTNYIVVIAVQSRTSGCKCISALRRDTTKALSRHSQALHHIWTQLKKINQT